MKSAAKADLNCEIEKAEFMATVQHALDLRYRQFCQNARADWERLFGSDPSDACVTVRVQSDPSIATRGSGFLKSRRPAIKRSSANSSVRFAH